MPAGALLPVYGAKGVPGERPHWLPSRRRAGRSGTHGGRVRLHSCADRYGSAVLASPLSAHPHRRCGYGIHCRRMPPTGPSYQSQPDPFLAEHLPRPRFVSHHPPLPHQRSGTREMSRCSTPCRNVDSTWCSPRRRATGLCRGCAVTCAIPIGSPARSGTLCRLHPTTPDRPRKNSAAPTRLCLAMSRAPCWELAPPA